MFAGFRNFGLYCLMAVLVLPPATAAGEDEHDDDHEAREAVREAVEHGRIKPLAEIMRAVKPKLPGEIVGVKAEIKAGVWVYEFRVTDRKGHMYEARVDAATAEILNIERK